MALLLLLLPLLPLLLLLLLLLLCVDPPEDLCLERVVPLPEPGGTDRGRGTQDVGREEELLAAEHGVHGLPLPHPRGQTGDAAQSPRAAGGGGGGDGRERREGACGRGQQQKRVVSVRVLQTGTTAQGRFQVAADNNCK